MSGRPIRIAVVSGKGGTGKTFISVNLACTAPCTLYDCDVEEPNTHLFFQTPWKQIQSVERRIPIIHASLCTLCASCSIFCRFHALLCSTDSVQVFPELCRSCGGCLLICPNQSISMITEEIGTVFKSSYDDALTLVQGVLKIGTAVVPPVVHEVLKVHSDDEIQFIDAPPGTGCSVMAAVSSADYVLAAAEPTPFGLHDFQVLVKALRSRGIPFSAAVNKALSHDDAITKYCREEGIKVSGRIFFDEKIMDICSKGGIAVKHIPEYRKIFSNLHSTIVEEAKRCVL